MKHIIHTINCDVYSTKFLVCFDVGTARKKLRFDADDTVEGMTGTRNGVPCIFLPMSEDGSLDFNATAHEAFHAVDRMHASKGVEFQPNGTNEHWAYMIGWLCGEILDRARKEYKYKVGL